ncbi:MAG: RNA methyltransferase [Ktedonobacteraceae bacterium]|nr:RNA methyltransferase [Ktedonobacteraceae bacterium]
MAIITSPANPHIRALQRLHTTRGRKKSGLFLMEGPHLLEALLDAHVMPREVYYQPGLLERTVQGQALLGRLRALTGREHFSLVEVSERVIEALGETQTSQGLVCVMDMADFSPRQVYARRVSRRRPALLILDDLADPGNMGTVLRTALAADVEAVLLTDNCVDHFSPKVVRAAAGAHVALPIEPDLSWSTIEARVLAHCTVGAGRDTSEIPRILLAESSSVHNYYDEDLTLPFALVIGNEARGPSAAARAHATASVSIPLFNGVESLNAAMAAGIILYEAVRQIHQGR